MFLPMNRHLLVKKPDTIERDTGVLVPNDYKTEDSEYSVVHLLAAHEDSKFDYSKNAKLVVPTHVIQEIDCCGEKYHVVLENHVIGRISN